MLCGAMFAVGVYYTVHVPEKWGWSSRWLACVFYVVMVAAWAPIVLLPAGTFIIEAFTRPLRGVRKVERHRL